MSLSSTGGAAPRPALKLFLADDEQTDALACGPRGLSPEMTLPEFFEAWYLPVILRAAGRKEVSIELLRTTLRWWVALTPNPPLRLIDDLAIAEFEAGLRGAQYRRGKIGVLRSLAPTTVGNHLRHVRWIIVRSGAKSAAQPQAANLIDPPHVPERTVRAQPKRPFTAAQWRGLFAAAQRSSRPAASSPALYWQVLLALLFYTGFRIGTVLRLGWEHLQCEEGAWWIDVPAELVSKTEKATRRIVHPSLLAALEAARAAGWPQLVPHVAHEDTLGKWHKELQAAAGVTRPLGWNAWRRTHTAELAKLGYQQTVTLLQQALDHSDASTTTSHYYDPLNDFIRRLPSVELPAADRQLTLF